MFTRANIGFVYDLFNGIRVSVSLFDFYSVNLLC